MALRCDSSYLFDDVAHLLSLVFKIVYRLYLNLVENGYSVRECFAELFLAAQVGCAVNLPLQAVNDGLVAVDGFLEN